MKSWKKLLAVATLSYAGHAVALGGLADLSVYDRTEGRQLAVHWHEGRAYVAGKPGNEYQVALRSRSGEEVLAELGGIDALATLITALSDDDLENVRFVKPAACSNRTVSFSPPRSVVSPP